MKYIIGIGGVTNGGKTTLTNRLIKTLPNCCVVHQDDFFKKPDHIQFGEDGFRQWDVITALDMEAMTNTVKGWMENPVKFARSHGVPLAPVPDVADPDNHIHILIRAVLVLRHHVLMLPVFHWLLCLEPESSPPCSPVRIDKGFSRKRLSVERRALYGFVDRLWLLPCRPMLDVFDKCYYITVPYEECKRRRSTRQYTVPDPPGLFDGHVWPMYLKHRKEMEDSGLNYEYLDGLKSKEEIYNQVYEDIQNNLLNRL
ncbi:unnamed protein product [Menidia menidia]|uniref:(Atlantic silverside) hypothetical protein n=1 Tax=Menidia menidia TaxID=238744 RepID=A0A8S4ABI0_9TELE|nr:unnamed protein product [Menidia menidia]